MTTVTIPKSEYSKIIKTQNELKKRVDFLQKLVVEEVCDEIKPSYAKKLDRISASADAGKGTGFDNVKDAIKYLDNF